MKIEIRRKYIISLTFCITFMVLTGIFYMSAEMNQIKYDKLKEVTTVLSAENFKNKFIQTSRIWNELLASEDISPSIYHSLYISSEAAIEEISKFPMREDVKRAARAYLSESSEMAKSAIGGEKTPDFEVIAKMSADGSEFAVLFSNAEISDTGEILFAGDSIPDKLIMSILKNNFYSGQTQEDSDEDAYYMRYRELEKKTASQQKASYTFGISNDGILNSAYSDRNRIYFSGNSYIETSDKGDQTLSLVFDSAVSQSNLTENECIMIAEKYLVSQGFTDYSPESVLFIDKILFADFISAENSEKSKIRIGIASDTGKVCFFSV